MPRAKQGACPLCERDAALTFHHLIPRKIHRRTHFKKHFSKQQLQAGIMICRTCHSGIHRQFNEMTLAKDLNSLSLLKEEPQLKSLFTWVSKQKIQT